MAGTTKLSVEKAIMLGLAKRSLSLGDRSRRNIGNLVLWLKPAVEAIGAFVIGIGISLAAQLFVFGFPPAIVVCGRATYVGALSGDCASISTWRSYSFTAMSPRWDAIGKLPRLAVIGTALKYFLGRDMHKTGTPRQPEA